MAQPAALQALRSTNLTVLEDVQFYRPCAHGPDGAHVPVVSEGGAFVYCEACGLVPGLIDTVFGLSTPIAERRAAAPPLVSKKKPKNQSKTNPVEGPVEKWEHWLSTSKFDAIIERDGLECFYCEEPLLDPRRTPPGTEWRATIDHLVPRALGGGHELANLVLACLHDNNVKADGVELLAEVIRRQRRRTRELEESLASTQALVDHLEWEMFDEGLGEMPGMVKIEPTQRHRAPKAFKRRRMSLRDPAMFCELDKRELRCLRNENTGKLAGRISTIIKRGRHAIT